MPKEIRQLAAIMFADIVGYTAMMQSDEKHARKLRIRHRGIIDAAIAEHAGLLMQSYGDGSLIVFSSAVDAIRCATAIQRQFQQEPKIPLRIGIHMGDIVYDDDSIYGDSVNIASRVESLSVPGAVLISEKLNDEIRNHPEFETIVVGEFVMKNVRQPMCLYAIKDDGIVTPKASTLSSPKASPVHSVAVLPFVNMSADQENEYFSDGISEELINALVRVSGLRVTSRTSSFAFKGRNLDVREIGKQLGVSTVLEGSVRKAGQRVRITAQLINADDGYHVFSETYDRDLEDIFDVQDEISRKIAGKLQDSFSGSQEDKPLVTKPTENLEAYNLYLKALHNWRKWTPQSVKEAIRDCEKAIELEPDFVLPYTVYSFSYTYLGAIGYLSSDYWYPKAKEAADKALLLNPGIAESHSALAGVKLYYEWDWNGAKDALLRALELSPGSAEAHNLYTMYLGIVGDFDGALKHALKALKIDPLSMLAHRNYVFPLILMERFEEALDFCDRMLDLDGDYLPAMELKGWITLWMGRKKEALLIFQNFQRRTDSELKGRTGLGYTLSQVGRTKEARECLEAVQKRMELYPELNLYVDLAILHAGLGELDQCFRYLQISVDKRLGGALHLQNGPGWKSLREDSRFDAIVEQIGLPGKSVYQDRSDSSSERSV